MQRLIRTIDGVELPAPGRWTIGSGHPVELHGAGARRTRVGRLAGALDVAVVPADTTIELAIAITDRSGTTTPITLAGRLATADRSGRWSFAATLDRLGHTTAADLAITYRGVYRHHGQATTWLTMTATVPPSRGGVGRRRRPLVLRAELTGSGPVGVVAGGGSPHSG